MGSILWYPTRRNLLWGIKGGRSFYKQPLKHDVLGNIDPNAGQEILHGIVLV
jgi:hypothetical protein